jgi:hypothetical protein
MGHASHEPWAYGPQTDAERAIWEAEREAALAAYQACAYAAWLSEQEEQEQQEQ